MASINYSDVQKIYKRLYDPASMIKLFGRNHALWQAIKKKKTVEGSGLEWLVETSGGSGSSRSLSKAVDAENSTGSKFLFRVNTGQEYASCAWLHKAALRSKQQGAFVDMVTNEINNKLTEMVDHMALKLFRDGTGAICYLTAASGATFTVPVNQCIHFPLGKKVQFYVDEAAALAGSEAVYTVTKVNRNSGVITVNTTIAAAVTSAPTTTRVGYDGDMIVDTSLTPDNLQVSFSELSGDAAILGLPAWIPTTAPTTGDSFSATGVDRSADVDFLAGFRDTISYTTLGYRSVAEGVISLMTLITTYNRKAMPDHVIMSPNRYKDLLVDAEAAVEYNTDESNKLGTKRQTVIKTPHGDLKIIVDPDQLDNRIHVVELSVLEIVHSTDALIEPIEDDGGPVMRTSATEDGFRKQFRSFWQFRVLKPGHCGVLSLT